MVPVSAVVSNKQTRSQRKEYATYEESEEEIHEPQVKRQKIQ